MGHSIVRMFAVAAACISLLSCTADESTSDTKIIGGRIADYQPFMISISKQDPERKSGFCGGSWIAEGVILTAAHCVEDLEDLAKVSVSITRESDIAAHNSLKVLAIVSHPQFDSKVMHNDIALLFVETLNHSGLSKPITPIPLNRRASLPEDLGKTTVIGWGNATSYGQIFGDELRQVDVPVVGLEKCRSAGGFYATISDNEICAGDFDNGAIDSCQGDSGGPLIAIDNGTPVLVGVVSWGDNCALKGKPGVYARVSSYTGWIYEQIGAFKSPVTSSEKNIKDAIAQHCYAGFSAKQTPYPDAPGFEVKSKFFFDLPMTKSLPSDPLSNPVLSTCSFNRLGLGQVDLEISKPENLPQAIVKLPGLNQVWTTEVREEKGLSVLCKVSDQESFFLEYSATGFNYIASKDAYGIFDEIEVADLSAYKQTTCSVQGTTMVFAEKEDAADNENKFILVLESTEIGLAKKHFKLLPFSGSDGKLETAFKADTDSPTKGTLSFENKTGNDIHTWEIECKIDMTLVDMYGVVYKANKKDESRYSHMFMTPVSIHGIIKNNESVTFTAEFAESPAEDTLKNCSINGVPLTLMTPNLAN